MRRNEMGRQRKGNKYQCRDIQPPVFYSLCLLFYFPQPVLVTINIELWIHLCYKSSKCRNNSTNMQVLTNLAQPLYFCQNNSTFVCPLLMSRRWPEELLMQSWGRKFSRNSCQTAEVHGMENRKPEHLLFFSKPVLGMIKRYETATCLCQVSRQQLSHSPYLTNSWDNPANI